MLDPTSRRVPRRGAILAFEFEGVTLRLGHDLRYTPDFAVWAVDGRLELHEVKGFMRDDARVKLHAAASKYQGRHRFVLVKATSRRLDTFTVEEVRT